MSEFGGSVAQLRAVATSVDDVELTYASLRAFNRWLEEDWGYGDDGRIFAVPMLSLLDLDQAMAELHRVIDAAGMTERYRKRTGYSLGVSFAPDWGEWQVLSLFEGIDVPLEPGMCFHVPTALREYGAFTVGISESIAITETGCTTPMA